MFNRNIPHIIVAFTTLLLLGKNSLSAAETEKIQNSTAVLTSDLFIPGSGAFLMDHPKTGAAIFFARTLSAYYAYTLNVQKTEYQSAERAARIADIYWGPGYNYKDPYSTGYLNAEGFRRKADQKRYYRNLSIGVHLIATAASLFFTRSLLENQTTYPVFDLEPESNGNKQSSLDFSKTKEGYHLTLGFIHRGF